MFIMDQYARWRLVCRAAASSNNTNKRTIEKGKTSGTIKAFLDYLLQSVNDTQLGMNSFLPSKTSP